MKRILLLMAFIFFKGIPTGEMLQQKPATVPASRFVVAGKTLQKFKKLNIEFEEEFDRMSQIFNLAFASNPENPFSILIARKLFAARRCDGQAVDILESLSVILEKKIDNPQNANNPLLQEVKYFHELLVCILDQELESNFGGSARWFLNKYKIEIIGSLMAAGIIAFGCKKLIIDPIYIQKHFEERMQQEAPGLVFTPVGKGCGVGQSGNTCALHAVANAFYLAEDPNADLSKVRDEVDGFVAFIKKYAILNTKEGLDEFCKRLIIAKNAAQDYEERKKIACDNAEARLKTRRAKQKELPPPTADEISSERNKASERFRGWYLQRPEYRNVSKISIMENILNIRKNRFLSTDQIFSVAQFFNESKLPPEVKAKIPPWAINPGKNGNVIIVSGDDPRFKDETSIFAWLNDLKNGLQQSMASNFFCEGSVDDCALDQAKITAFQGGTPLSIVFRRPGHWICARMELKQEEAAKKTLKVTCVDSTVKDDGSLFYQRELNTLREIGNLLAIAPAAT